MTITSANSVFTIIVPGLFPVPVQLEGYHSDEAFTTDDLDVAEVNMGVDGRMTAGYTPMPTVQRVTLQADSPSVEIFESILQAMQTAREIFYISGSISLPGPAKFYTLTRGVLVRAKILPDARKVLQAMGYGITWERVNKSLL